MTYESEAYDAIIPWVIPDAHCLNCGRQLALCSGVGRLVIRHDDNTTACFTAPTVKLKTGDQGKVNAALAEAEAAYQAKLAEKDDVVKFPADAVYKPR